MAWRPAYCRGASKFVTAIACRGAYGHDCRVSDRDRAGDGGRTGDPGSGREHAAPRGPRAATPGHIPARAEVEIPTARLVLHGVDPAQAEKLARGISPLPCVAGYPHADSDTAARMQRHALEVDNWVPGYGLYLMVRRADGLVVGDIGFHTPPDQRGAAEVSYGVADSVRRRGYASEALVALTAWAHAHGASTVLAEVDPTNHASRGVLAKAGFLPVRSDGPKLRLRHQG